MGFNLRVSFTGLTGFVRNSKAGAYPPMCVLMPDGSEPRRALDGTPLCIHRPFMKFPIDLVRNSTGVRESFGLWYLDHERLYFDVEEEIPTAPLLVLREKPFPGKEEPDLKDPECRESLTWMMDLSRIFPQFKLHRDALKQSPSKESSVGCQVVIDRGILSSRLFTRAVWDCDEILSGSYYRLVFTHVVDLFIGGLKKAEAVAVGLDNPSSQRVLDLSKLPPVGNEVAVKIFNVCDRNPLEWSPLAQVEADQDTKWFYELLEPADKEKLRKNLGAHELPIPRPLRSFDPGEGFGSPGSGNCIPPNLGSSAFELPKLSRTTDATKAPGEISDDCTS